MQFNLDVPADPENLRTDFASPSAIVFERILPVAHRPAVGVRPRRSGSPVRLSVLSTDRLSKALQLAKQDLKSARRRKALKVFAKENQLSISTDPEKESKPTSNSRAVVNLPINKSYQTQTPKKKVGQRMKKESPKRQRNDNVTLPQKISKHDQEMFDIKRLRLELRQHIFSMVKNMQDRGILHHQKLLTLDQEEEQRLIVRHLEQMRKSSRTVYALQQQAQVIKEELRRSSSADKTPNNKKERLLGRLAAVHRGAVRLMQVYCTQLPEHLMFDDNFIAISALYQEVSRLLKELSLCSLQLDLANIEEVEKISDILKDMEPKYIPKTKSPKSDRHPRSPARQNKTPQRSFKSKEIVLVKKSYVQPKHSQNSFMKSPQRQHKTANIVQHPQQALGDLTRQQMTDLYDRPEWVPPPNSPYKSVGPPPLTPLLESPAPSRAFRTHPIKQVKFHSTPNHRPSVEHDIDSLTEETPRDLNLLKSKLASELETELRNRIDPLLQKVERLAKSANSNPPKSRKSPEDEILEDQVRDIIDETRKEMKSFHQQQQLEEEAVNLYQGPSIETLLSRLDSIGREEEAIRRRWQEINYLDMKPEDPISSKSNYDSAPGSPQPINFTKTGHLTVTISPKKIVNFLPQEDTAEIRHEPTVKSLRREMALKSEQPFTGRTLVLPESTITTINRSKKEYQRHLKFTFHEPRGNFDPWKLVEELSDKVLDDVITSVTNEMNGMCEEYADEIFRGEFANASRSSDSSLFTSSSLSETTPLKQ